MISGSNIRPNCQLMVQISSKFPTALHLFSGDGSMDEMFDFPTVHRRSIKVGNLKLSTNVILLHWCCVEISRKLSLFYSDLRGEANN